MVSSMFVPFNRTAITAAWFIVLGLVALVWSPPSLAMGLFVVLFLFGGLAGPAAMLILSHQPSPMVVRAVASAEGLRVAR
jgi:hypothetical protein